jgi:energy-coupling factor transport system permease protein
MVAPISISCQDNRQKRLRLRVWLALIAWAISRGRGRFFVGFTLLEIVIMAIVGVVNGALGTPNGTLGPLFMTFSGAYGFLAFAAICGGFYVSSPLCGYIICEPGAAALAETMNVVAQLLWATPTVSRCWQPASCRASCLTWVSPFFGYAK